MTSAIATLTVAKSKIASLIAALEVIQPKQRAHKCLMCNQGYGVLDDLNFNPYVLTAKCGHKGPGANCAEYRHGTPSSSTADGTCGLLPDTHDCYECRLKNHSSVCLMCNQPYGGTTPQSVLQLVKAKCGHEGNGDWCSSGSHMGDAAVDVFNCSIDPATNNCYACRNP